MVKKTKGSDPTWTFVYDDGTEIEMDSTMNRQAPRTFAEKFGSKFNYFPDISRDEWLEMLNEWVREVRVVEVSPLTIEGRAKEVVQESIQDAYAVPEKDDLAAAGEEAVAYYDDMDAIIVRSSLLETWLEDLDTSLRQAREYLDPILHSDTKRLRVDGVRRRFWLFNVETMEDNGYIMPDPKGLPDEPDESEGVEEL